MKSRLTYTEIKDSLLMLLICGIASLGIARGFIWITDGDEVLESAAVYKKVAEFLPIQTLGLLFLFGGIFVAIGAVAKGKISYYFLLIGGFLSTLCGLPMYMASTLEGVNHYTPLSVGIVAGLNMILALTGVVLLWTEKKNHL